ncbi:histidine phosphatase superfamily [Boletus edulis BED1]|uniref:Histidine phosphatase superfamily n=1 Tax=Boletus edulis BED1 TaxID=1328754 RepID=A0AAD4C1T0_BOLED|nr:histidine phosphatase superfamily [Boletus edulis BED1]
MVETIYVARHGFRANWVTSSWTTPTGLARDPPLAAYGETQAVELASYLGLLPKDKQPSAIFSSPYYRCLQTSKPVAERLFLPIYIEHGLSEWYSPVVPGTGLFPRPKRAIELRAMLPEISPSWNTVEIDPSWRSIWLPPRKGEDLEGIQARMSDFLVRFIYQIETRPDMCHHKNILLLSHAAPIITMCRHLLAQPKLPLRVGCCTLSQFSRGRDTASGQGSSWEAVLLASSAHLTDQTSLRDWGLEDIVTDDVTGKVVCDVGVPGTEGEDDDTFGPQIYSNKL